MKRSRDSRGRFKKQYRTASFGERVIVLSAIVLTIGIIVSEEYKQFTKPVEAHVEQTEWSTENTLEEPREVRIEVVIDWTEERIIKEIENTFFENPKIAVAIAKCESGLNPTIRSHHILHYGQEESYGIFQIHAPDWDNVATRLGYLDYQTDIQDNLKMARYIYDQRGGFEDWTCYTKGLYKKHL